jgi:hypothetical protein
MLFSKFSLYLQLIIGTTVGTVDEIILKFFSESQTWQEKRRLVD